MSRLFDALENIEKRKQAGSENRLPPFSIPRSSSSPGRKNGLWLLVAGVLIMVLASAAWVFSTRHHMRDMAAASMELLPADHTSRPGSMAPAIREKKEAVTSNFAKGIFQKIPKTESHKAATAANAKQDRTTAMKPHTGTASKTYRPMQHRTAISSRQNRHGLKTSGIFSGEVKRMLQQAEEHQNSGDIIGAAGIYQNLWNSTENPLIANNLAACLIVLGRRHEAQAILEKALKLAPHDPDLLYNLALTKSRGSGGFN